MWTYYARKATLVIVPCGVFALSVFFANQFTSKEVDCRDKKKKDLLNTSDDDGDKSYVHHPMRTQTFQRIASTYDDQIDLDEVVMGIKILRRALLYFHGHGDVLEIAAGTGRNVGYYPSNVNKIVLTDTSDQMLLRAWNKLQDTSPEYRKKFQIFVADASRLPYLDNSFDCVVDTFGLCSFDDPIAVLKEMSRICKPTGKILLLEHGRSKSFHGLSNYLDNHAETHAKNWGCVWNRDINELLLEAGLEIERVHTWHFGTTYYVVCRPCKEAKS